MQITGKTGGRVRAGPFGTGSGTRMTEVVMGVQPVASHGGRVGTSAQASGPMIKFAAHSLLIGIPLIQYDHQRLAENL